MGGTCVICGGSFNGHNNNAYPYAGKCCDRCNSMVVIPARVRQSHLGRRLTKDEMDALIETAGITREDSDA